MAAATSGQVSGLRGKLILACTARPGRGPGPGNHAIDGRPGIADGQELRPMASYTPFRVTPAAIVSMMPSSPHSASSRSSATPSRT